VNSGEVTVLLQNIRNGDRESWNRLVPIVYQELHAVASARVASPASQTLGATALVHELYLKLSETTSLELVDRRHFFAVAATAMRQILVDHARAKAAKKRGGDQVRAELRDGDGALPDRSSEILAVHEALDRLARYAERPARVAELRYFGGLTVEETAEVLEIDARTVKRDWRKARALLYGMLHDE
jgi:RNA polymerase sigma factor (TIGR02999 family)